VRVQLSGLVILSTGLRVSKVGLQRSRPATVIPSGARNPVNLLRHSERSEESS